ncbi:hypothetical protein SCLCIDRAFT_142777, partial [Scleroderma citrinum Foug A]
LTEQKPWKHEMKDIIQLIAHLSHVAFKRLGVPWNDGGSWSAHPIVVKPLQFNGYDCGLWVLALISAILRGYDITNLHEGDMPEFCHYLFLAYQYLASSYIGLLLYGFPPISNSNASSVIQWMSQACHCNQHATIWS